MEVQLFRYRFIIKYNKYIIIKFNNTINNDHISITYFNPSQKLHQHKKRRSSHNPLTLHMKSPRANYHTPQNVSMLYVPPQQRHETNSYNQ